MLKKNIQIINCTIRKMFLIARKEEKIVFVLYVLRFFCDLLLKIKTIVIPKFIIDELILIQEGAEINSHLNNVIIYVLIIVGSELVAKLLLEFVVLNLNVQAERFNEYVNETIAGKCMRMDFEQTEDPNVLDQMNKGKEGMTWYSGGVIGVLDSVYAIVLNIIAFMVSIGIIIAYCPFLFPIQLLALSCTSYFTARNNKIEVEVHMAMSKINRVFGYVLFTLQDFAYGKDIRLYDGADMIEKKEKYHINEIQSIFKMAAKKQKGNSIANILINIIRDGIGYVYIGYLAIKKVISIGDFSMCTAASSELFQSLTGIANGIQDITKKCNYAYQYVLFMEYPEALKKGDLEINNESQHCIEFKHVSFKYPRSDKYVLKDINLKISFGEHIAIVGLNGAGKTTFIKLLCRLYNVNEGEILIDGINIESYSMDDYRKLFAVVFQDFQLFAFTLKDNICFDNKNGVGEFERINAALKMSGLYNDVMNLPSGLNTYISKYFEENGIELSGGQKQKLAIARAIYKNSSIVILDEPTAALDPVAEYEIYNKFDDLVGEKTAIYISHRLSSCKFCEKIVVFSESTIKECGSHSELINIKDGIYANMFNKQAQYYQD
ncbi:ABC transporter ATP-binding protein [uncultured Eubacterium sp.]|uniref:ABC transporter ATP-binding protein n=1 Tax=uncultured Eubacterium sp. TaxID=165185 RepID=UPI002672FF25|nr:ABC transporter ATP-binding protein [uncultured Eubacterium sp.]